MSMLQPVDLAALALDCLRLLQPVALARGVSVVLQFEPPDARPESRVMPSRPLSLEECARTEMKKAGKTPAFDSRRAHSCHSALPAPAHQAQAEHPGADKQQARGLGHYRELHQRIGELDRIAAERGPAYPGA